MAITLFGSCGEPEREVTLLLTNPVDKFRADEPIEIKRSQLSHPRGDSTLWPVLRGADRRLIPTQIDGFGADSIWKTLCFVYDFRPGDSVRLNVEWVKPSQYPHFQPRTNIRFASELSPGAPVVEQAEVLRSGDLSGLQNHTPFQYKSILWENDKMGFRHHFAGKNTRGLFGKRLSRMVLDSVGLTADGRLSRPPFKKESWGEDILFIGNSTGLGGLALRMPDGRIVRLGVRSSVSADNVDSTRFTRLSEGPVRSVFQLDFYGWRLPDSTRMDVSQQVTIWAGQYGYENRVQTSGQPDSSFLVTGIPTYMLTRNPVVRIYDEGYAAAMTFDKQTRSRQDNLGMAIVVPDENYEKPLPIPARSDEDVQKMCAVLLKSGPDGALRFYVCAAWDAVEDDFESIDYFERAIKNRVRLLKNPIHLEVITAPPASGGR